MKIRDIDVVILCGGLGARLHSITKDKVQKCMVDVNGKPFLEILVSDLKAQGLEKFILCAGHKIDSISGEHVGLYIFHKKVLDFIKENSKLSLEENILSHMKVKEIVGPIPFIDIGTPEGYKEINNLFI